MDEAHQRARCKAVGMEQHRIERCVAKKGSGCRGDANGNPSVEQSRLDFAQGQGRSQGGRAVAADWRVGQESTCDIWNLEIGNIDAHAFEADHRLARPQAKADHQTRPYFLHQTLQIRLEASIGDRKYAAGYCERADALAVKSLRHLACGVASTP